MHLLRTFADQAVIAIENAQLFHEVQARTRDLTQVLQHTPATAEVLQGSSADGRRRSSSWSRPGELRQALPARRLGHGRQSDFAR